MLGKLDILLKASFGLSVFLIIFSYISLHFSLHAINRCEMTYMWRAMQYLKIDVDAEPTNNYTYSLLIYNEGPEYLYTKSLRPKDIPVLFLPGSGGSFQQVRSIASVVQNNTEMKNAPFRFRFFTVNFDEQLSFISGNIVEAQIKWAYECVKTIKKMAGDDRKIILYGHSFGGVVAMGLINHELFQPEWVDLIITNAAPLRNAPLIMDDAMNIVMTKLKETWHEKRSSVLRHIGVVSYSSGLRDIQVHDSSSYLDNTIHRPAWAVPGVPDDGADHLCMLWCNMLVRHTSRIFYQYGLSERNVTGRKIVDTFFKEERKLAPVVPRYNLKPLTYGDDYKGRIVRDVEGFSVFLEPLETVFVNIDSTCLSTITVMHPNKLYHSQPAVKGRTTILVYRENFANVMVLLTGSKGCEYVVHMPRPGIMALWKWYETCLVNTRALSQHIVLDLIRFILLEKVMELDLVLPAYAIRNVLCGLYLLNTLSSSVYLIAPAILGSFISMVYFEICTVLGRITRFFWRKIIPRTRMLIRGLMFIPIIFLRVYYPKIINPLVGIYYSAGISHRAMYLSIPLFIVVFSPHMYTYDIATYTKWDLLNTFAVSLLLFHQHFHITELDCADSVINVIKHAVIGFLTISYSMEYNREYDLQSMIEVFFKFLAVCAFVVFPDECERPMCRHPFSRNVRPQPQPVPGRRNRRRN